MHRRLALNILGLPDGASDEAIDRAFREAAMANHPDRFPTDPNALVRMTAINLARSALREIVPAPVVEPEHHLERPTSSLDALVDSPMPRSARIRGLRPNRRTTEEHPAVPAVRRAA